MVKALRVFVVTLIVAVQLAIALQLDSSEAGIEHPLERNMQESMFEPADSQLARRDTPLIRQAQSQILPALRSIDEYDEDDEDDLHYVSRSQKRASSTSSRHKHPDPSHVPTSPGHKKKKNGHHCSKSVS